MAWTCHYQGEHLHPHERAVPLNSSSAWPTQLSQLRAGPGQRSRACRRNVTDGQGQEDSTLNERRSAATHSSGGLVIPSRFPPGFAAQLREAETHGWVSRKPPCVQHNHWPAAGSPLTSSLWQLWVPFSTKN